MAELLTAAQMRAVESGAIASGRVTGLALMERAGRGVVAAIFDAWPPLRAKAGRAVVLCGPGNNGGDGFVVARLLHDHGWRVDVFLHGDAKTLPPDARANHARWCAMGGVRPAAAGLCTVMDGGTPDLWIDALFGTGLTRPLSPQSADTLNSIAKLLAEQPADRRGKCVAIDLPSGVESDSGRVLAGPDGAQGQPLSCDLTVTFHREKLGHRIGSGPEFCGQVVTVDIGLDGSVPKAAQLFDGADMASRVQKGGARHKYSYGHALVMAGPVGQGGAARLAARGALRIGAGLVTVGCPPPAMAEAAAQLTAVMLRPVQDARALGQVLGDGRINALCLGPGLGVEWAADLLAVALAGSRATVLDADALTALSRDAGLFAGLHSGCVLTPHGGEFARLFPDIAASLADPASKGPAVSRADACRRAAARAGCVVLLKGPDTVIADASGRCAVQSAAYDRAAPWLATAGAGDVLAGFITGLLARGLAPFEAACAGAWLHVESARAFGPGLIAEDLPEALPAVLRRLGA